MSVKLFWSQSQKSINQSLAPKKPRELKHLLSETGSLAAKGVCQIAKEMEQSEPGCTDRFAVASILYRKIRCAKRTGEKSISYRGRNFQIVDLPVTNKTIEE